LAIMNIRNRKHPGSAGESDWMYYMWWDRFPSGGMTTATDAERPAVDDELIGVMARALRIEHAACQESLLHGFGHRASGNEDRVGAIIDMACRSSTSARRAP